MGQNDYQFRSAAMGGFVKQDVLSYLEGIESDYATKLAAIEKILAASQSSRNEAEKKLALLVKQREAEQSNAERLNNVIEELQGQLSELTAELEEKDAALQAALEELEALRLQSGGADHSEELEDLRARLAEQETMIPILQRENLSLRAKMEKMSATEGNAEQLYVMQEELLQREVTLQSKEMELDSLREKLLEFERVSETLASAQAKAEELEASAQRHAEDIVAAARTKAAQVREETDARLEKMKQKYVKLKIDASHSVVRAEAELARTKAALEQLTEGDVRVDGDFLAHKAPPLELVKGTGWGGT